MAWKLPSAMANLPSMPKAKKTDVKDCRWIQKLHALGLLTSVSSPES